MVVKVTRAQGIPVKTAVIDSEVEVGIASIRKLLEAILEIETEVLEILEVMNPMLSAGMPGVAAEIVKLDTMILSAKGKTSTITIGGVEKVIEVV